MPVGAELGGEMVPSEDTAAGGLRDEQGEAAIVVVVGVVSSNESNLLVEVSSSALMVEVALPSASCVSLLTAPSAMTASIPTASWDVPQVGHALTDLPSPRMEDQCRLVQPEFSRDS